MIKLARLIILVPIVLLACSSDDPTPPAPTLYFPPLEAGTWDTTSPSELGWNTDKIDDLDNFMVDTDTRALLVLKDGRIVIEKYAGKELLTLNDFTSTSNWYWASAGKTLTSAVVGIAASKGLIDFDESSSTYLGEGWTSLDPTQEEKIKVRHQLTMTSGLDDSGDKDCADPECLIYLAEPGTRWAYHNGPYTLLDGVIEGATGKSLNTYLDDELKSKIGMDGLYIQTGENNVYYSTPRTMARFGLLLLNKGKWGETQVIPEDYVELMTNTSQNLNFSYGYLTWLNGKESFMAPGAQTIFPWYLSPDAPEDMFAAMGKNGQLINVVPSKNLIVIRMGDSPDTNLVPFLFQNTLWEKLNEIIE